MEARVCPLQMCCLMVSWSYTGKKEAILRSTKKNTDQPSLADEWLPKSYFSLPDELEKVDKLLSSVLSARLEGEADRAGASREPPDGAQGGSERGGADLPPDGAEAKASPWAVY